MRSGGGGLPAGPAIPFGRLAFGVAGGIRPHYYCLPVAKRETHRLALVEAGVTLLADAGIDPAEIGKLIEAAKR